MKADTTPIAAAHKLTSECALLGLLYQQSTHGYEIHQRLMSELGFVWEVSITQTYNALKSLERKGLISSAMHEPDKRPARRHLMLTSAGEMRFHTWLNAPIPHRLDIVQIDFLTRLHFMAQLYPDRVMPLLSAQEQQVHKAIDRLRQQLLQIPEMKHANQLCVELRTRQLLALVDWLDICRRRFETR